MPPILQWGLELIAAIQKIHGPVLDRIALAFTTLGEEIFFLLLLPLIYWCFDPRLGVRVGIFFLISNYFNTGLKDLFRQPRPFDLVPSLRLAPAEGYGLPSGHAQTAVIVWGSIAASLRKTWAWVGAVALMALIGLSRIFLGVHFPTDVLAGWAIGGLLLGVFLSVQARAGERLAGLRAGPLIVLALAASGLMLLVHATNDTVTVSGTLGGFGTGLALASANGYLAFDAGDKWGQRLLRFLVGTVFLFLIHFGLKILFPDEAARYYQVFRYVRYALVGVWVSYGAPWLFRRLRLVGGTAAGGLVAR